MKDIEIQLGKPYTSREGDCAGLLKITFSAVFDEEDHALAFHQNLVQLIREARTPAAKPTERTDA